MRRTLVTALAAMAAPFALAAQAPQQSGSASADLREWQVPWGREGRPRDPHTDREGRVWFVGQAGNYVAYLNPSSGDFRRFEIDSGAHPHNLVVDRQGQVWFTGNRNGRLYRMDPSSGRFTSWPVPEGVRDPHTMIFDQAGDAWFTAQQAGVVGRFSPRTGQYRLWRLAQGSRPYGIEIDRNGRPWFVEFGTNRIGTIDPRTGDLREYTLPNDRTRPRRIAITSDGAVWYGDYTRGFLGRLDPATGNVEEWALPSAAASLPYAVTVDDQDRVWLAETGTVPNRLVAFDTRSRQWTRTLEIPSGPRNTVRHMTFDRSTGQIWFGTDAGTIGFGRARQVTP